MQAVKFNAPVTDGADKLPPRAAANEPQLGENQGSIQSGPLVFSLRHYGKYATEIMVASVVINTIALGMPVFTMLVYNRVIGNRVPDTLWALAVGALILACVELVLRGARAYFVEHISSRWDVLFDRRVFAASAKVPLEKLPDVGGLMHRYRDTQGSRDFLSAGYLFGLADIPFLPLYLGVLALVGSWVVGIPLVLAGLLFGWTYLCHVVSHAYYKASIPFAAKKLEFLSTSVMAAEMFRMSPLGTGLEAKLVQASATAAVLGARSRYWNALGSNGVAFLSGFASIATLVLGVFLVESQVMTMGALIASSMLVSRVLASVTSMSNSLHKYKDFKESLERLAKELPGATSLESMKPAPGPVAEERKNEQGPLLSMQQVSYGYSKESRAILKGIDLEIHPGERVAIVGRSGSGKSTLLRLLSGLVMPLDGQYLVDFCRVDEDSAGRVRGLVAYKPQEPQLIDGTVLQNVTCYSARASEAVATSLLREVGLTAALQNGEIALNNPVGEQGRLLSGGQRQMVALARTLYQMRPVLILDEPTLGLDQMSQMAVIRAIAQLPAHVTVIVATHSTELIQIMNRIVAVDGGRKVADGLRESLLVTAQHRTATPHAASAA